MENMNLTILNPLSTKKPTLVFLSGLFAGDWIWQKTIEDDRFKDNKLVVLKKPLVDYAEGKLSLLSIVSNVKQILLEQKIHDNICFVGNSLGSLVGLLIAQDKSINTTKIILSGCPCRNKNINLGTGHVVTPNLDFMHTLRSKLFYDSSVITDEMLNNVMQTTHTRANFVKILRILRELDSFSIESYLSDSLAPIKLVWGKNDNVTPLCHWESTLGLNPLISLDIIDECGHSPMLEKPQHFNKILNHYINH